MVSTTATLHPIGESDFTDDPHATRYRDELDRHPEAFRRLFALLNDPTNEQRLVDAEMHRLPALCGVVRFIESDPAIEPVLAEGRGAHRFRQTVGVAVKLKMAKLGWRTTGRKGTVRGATYFTKAEHYAAAETPGDDPREKALAALDAVAEIGDDTEREATGRRLMAALAATRRAEGRPF